MVKKCWYYKVCKINSSPRFVIARRCDVREVDETQSFQTIDGFGYTLTGGSAEVINGLDAVKKQQLSQELFGNGIISISISYLRISFEPSDLNSSVF